MRGAIGFPPVVFRPPSSPDAAPVFEARAVSEGSCGMLSAVAPSLITARFEKFPTGGSGVVKTKMQASC